MNKDTKVTAYRLILKAENAANDLRDAVQTLDGIGFKTPERSRDEAARIHWGLVQVRDKLERDLGLAATMDQYGEPLGKEPGEDEQG